MSEPYPLRPLGDVMRLDVERMSMDAGTKYRLSGVLNAGQGLIDKGEFDGADTDYKAMNVLRTDKVVMRKLTAWEGPITVVPKEFDGYVVSNEFPTLTLGPNVVPGWMRLVCSSPRLWAEMKSRVSGTVQRRKRLNPDQLLQIEFPIPPLAVQKRTVEMVGAVDDQIAALETEAVQPEKTALAVAELLVATAPRSVLRNHLARIDGGRSPQARDAVPGPDEPGVLKVSAVTAFRFVESEAKVLLPQTEMPRTAEVEGGDVLTTRANGSIDRVGAVCRVPNDVRPRLYLSDKTLRLVPNASLDPDFLVAAMGLADTRRQVVIAASGSASMKNISQAKIAGLEIPLPSLAEQRRIASLVLSVRNLATTIRREVCHLRAVRSALLDGALSGRIELADVESVAASRPGVSPEQV